MAVGEPVEGLIERAVEALNRGDLGGARALADEVLTSDAGNLEAQEVRAAAAVSAAELRRLTIVFCDLVGSTELSSRLDPETYHAVLQRYQELCRQHLEGAVGGSIISFRGDGILAAFGHPEAHEDDVDRAVQGSLALLEAIAGLSADLVQQLGETLEARLAVHRGLVYLDRDRNDLFGYAVNVAARLEALAAPGTMVVSDEVRALLDDRYAVEAHPPRLVKGVPEPLASHTVHSVQGRRAGPVADQPLVGRDDELATVRGCWAAARSRQRARGASLAIVGEAGMGKSRLVAELRATAVADGATVLELAGAPLHTGSGLWPVRQLLEERLGAGAQRDGPGRLGRLRQLVELVGLDEVTVALLATLLGLEPSAGFDRVESDDRRLREQVEEAALSFLRSSFGPSGTVVIAEDAHWFDEATLDLVRRMVRLDDPDLLVVQATRDPATVPPGDRTTIVALGPLDGPACLDLLDALGGSALEPEERRTVAERSDGVPLFAAELVRAALLERERGGAMEEVVAVPGHAGVPEVLYAPLVARLNVAPQAMTVAASAAAIGRDVDARLLARSCPLDESDLHAGIEALLEAGILEPHAARPGDLRFHHELLRAVVEDLVPPARSRELHRRVAQALVAEGADATDWFVVGAHLEAAGQVGDAADAFVRASASARRRGALHEARDLLTRAVDVLAGSSQAHDRQELDARLQRGYLTVSLEGNTSATVMADYERAMELALRSDDADGLIATSTCLAAYHLAKGDTARTQAVYEAMHQVTGPLRPVAEFLATTGQALATFYRGDFAGARHLGEVARERGNALGSFEAYQDWFFVPLDPWATVHGTTGIGGFFMGDVEIWEQLALESRALAAELPFPTGAFTLAGMLTFQVWIAVEMERLDVVDGLLAEIDDLSARHGFDQWSIVAGTQREMVAALRAVAEGAEPSEIARCAHTLGGYVAMWKMVDQWVFVTYYTTMQGVLFARAGERDLARTALEEALAIAERTEMHFYDAETLRHLAALEEDGERRVAGLRRALELARQQQAAIFELRAAVDLHQLSGDATELRAAVERFPASASYPALDQARAVVALAR